MKTTLLEMLLLIIGIGLIIAILIDVSIDGELSEAWAKLFEVMG